MRYAFLIFFLLFAVLPVTANAALAEPVLVEMVDAIDVQVAETDEATAENTLYIRVSELYPPVMVERPACYVGLNAPLLWRPPMRMAV